MEIVLRAAVIFVFLWIVTRAVGRSTLGELSTFELLLYVTMGDLVQQAVTQQDYSVTGGMLAVSTFALLTLSLSWVQWRFPLMRPIVTGRPLVVFADGAPVEENLRTQRLTLGDLLAAAREQGIGRTSEIEYAVMEADGRISFFTQDSDSDGAPEKSAAS
ncbi:MAG: YetF domain-containing protein [Nocardioides sp.]